MSTGKTILVHGGLAAGFLAVVGYFFAQVAGMWVASQAPPRSGADAGTDTLVSTLEWRLPFTMAAIGFAIVAVGEGLRSLWRKPTIAVEPATPEAELQRLLKEAEEKLAVAATK